MFLANSCKRCRACLLLAAGALVLPTATLADDAQKANDNIKEVSGTAEFLRTLPKRFAFLEKVDPDRAQATLRAEGEAQSKTWALMPDAEVKFHGWWGRLDQFQPGDRVWVWFKTDRRQKPTAIAMLADELSEQDIHGPGLTVVAHGENSLTVQASGQKGHRTVQLPPAARLLRDKTSRPLDSLRPGEKVYLQSTADGVRLIGDRSAFEGLQAEQKATLRRRWSEQGLPGTVSFLHIFSGEMDLLLDHEAMRWGRSLKLGDKVTLQGSPPIAAVVKSVQPWRERTQVRLVVNGLDQADLTIGQRIGLRMKPPPAIVDDARLPPDLGLSRTKEERVEWFLASIYCTCGIAGDICTGHFYTLASCNPNGCGMPRAVRKDLADKIDRGLSDRQIFEALLKEQGPNLLHPHLMP